MVLQIAAGVIIGGSILFGLYTGVRGVASNDSKLRGMSEWTFGISVLIAWGIIYKAMG